jgi:DNA-directed RNA polymerase specialized sigma24 family protein
MEWSWTPGSEGLSHWLRHDAVVNRSREPLGMLADRPAPDPVAAAAIDEVRGDVDLEDALAALPAQSRHAVELRVVDGSSYEEISQALGCTRSRRASGCHGRWRSCVVISS